MNIPKATETSEFWVTAVVNIVAAIIAILAARGLVTAEEGELWVQLASAIALAVAPIVMAIVSKSYVESRTELRRVVAETQLWQAQAHAINGK
jgi:hypothetical protein